MKAPLANDGQIAKDTLFGPERLAARAIDWDRSDRGPSSGRAVTVLHSGRPIHGRNLNYAIFNRKALAPREPSIHGSSAMANSKVEGLVGYARRNVTVPVPVAESFGAFNEVLTDTCRKRQQAILRGKSTSIACGAFYGT